MLAGPTLVTGATGFIGLEVARQLAAPCSRTRLMIHRPHRAPFLAGLGGELVRADLEDPATLVPAVAGMHTVIHLAGHATFESYSVVRATLVDGTASLARAAAKEGVRRFVFASSTLVYDGLRNPVDAATPAAPWTGYGRAKAEAEAALRDVAAASPMQLSILRLPHVYGARDAMLGMARRGLLVAPGDVNRPLSHLHVADAARALIAAAACGWSGTSPIADHAPASWRELIALLRVEYRGLRVLRVPQVVAALGARVPALAARLRGRPTLLSPEAVAGWNRSTVVAPGTLWPALGVSPRFPTIADGIPAAARERLPDGWLHSVDDPRRD